MSKERNVEVVYPFIQCEQCPIAKNVVDSAVNYNPYSSNVPTKLEKIGLACVVDGNNIAHMNGIRLDSWTLTEDGLFHKKGDIEYTSDTLSRAASNAPDFCPQLKTD